MSRAAGQPTIHGRLVELELVTRRIERAAAGTLQVALLEGEAGIGKSRLLAAALELAGKRGFRIFLGHADELERARPFGALAEALDCTPGGAAPKRASLAELLAGAPHGPQPAIDLTRDPGLQYRVVDAFVDLVEEESLAGPVALALEDLQWSDQSTQLAVRSLTRRLGYLPLAVLATLRPVPRGPELERLVESLVEDGAEHVVLGALDEGSVRDLVAELVEAEPSPDLLAQVAGAAGNPLFVLELVQALEDEGALRLVDGRAELGDLSLPPSLRLTILRRLSFLGEETLELLQVASVLGSAFSLRDVRAVQGGPVRAALKAVREAVRAGVLEERESRLAFRHDLIREAVYEDLPADVRASLHLEAGRRLAAAGAPALQVAEQLALGARVGDPEAIAWLHAAAREAARRAPQTAVELLERALELTGASDERRLPILADLVPTLLWAGQPRRAEETARDALAGRPLPSLKGSLLLGLVEALTAQGRTRGVIEEFDRALSGVELTADVRSQLLAEKANALGFTVDLDTSERAAREAVAIGARARGSGVEMGLLVLSDTARARGRLHDALAHANDALERARGHPGSRPRWPPEIFVAMALRNLDRFEEAHEAIREGRGIDERVGNASYLPVYHYEVASLLFDAGEWDEAVAQAETGLAVADEVGLGMLLTWPNGLLALVAVHRGDVEAARAWIAAIEHNAPESERSDDFAPQPGLTRALLEEAYGNAEDALAMLEDAWDRDVSRGFVARRRLLGPPLTRLALAAGDRGRAEAVARGLEEAAALASVPSLEAAALRCRGLVEEDVDLLLRSVEAYRSGPRAFERAGACEDAAARLGRAGRVGEAKALFEEALEVYERIGADWDTGRALASMRELGIGRKRRGARKRAESGWEALTPSELEVVRLAAEGLTNPEIGQRLYISRRTVQTHLSHAFRKLDISSRVELAAEVARRGASGSAAVPTSR